MSFEGFVHHVHPVLDKGESDRDFLARRLGVYHIGMHAGERRIDILNGCVIFGVYGFDSATSLTSPRGSLPSIRD